MAVYTRRGTHGQIVHELALRIFAGRYGEGQVLDLPALESEFDISRTVLRESLKVLAAKGLVDARQKRGTFVRARDDWNLLDADVIRWQFTGRADTKFLDDLAEVRGIVEPVCARLAALRRTDEDLERLERALAAMASAYRDGDSEAAIETDLAFHRGLLAATHNELLRRMEMVLESGLAERAKLVHGARDVSDPVPSHLAVLTAVRRRRPEAAEAAMYLLLEVAEKDVRAIAGTE